jgi:site-specific recombinase XerD
LGPGSRRSQRNALDILADILSDGACGDADGFSWHTLTASEVDRTRAVLADNYSAATANRMLSALRGTLKAAHELGRMDTAAYHNASAVRSLPENKAGDNRGGSTPKELRGLFHACADGSPTGRRDAALLALLYGLTRAEVVALDLADYSPRKDLLCVPGGPIGLRRDFPVLPGAKEALEDWLAQRGRRPGPLVTRVMKGGAVTLDRITDQSAYNALKRRAADAGIPGLTPNDLRAAFARDMLAAGADLAHVQGIMCHASPSTTQTYARGNGASPQRPHLRVPYVAEE